MGAVCPLLTLLIFRLEQTVLQSVLHAAAAVHHDEGSQSGFQRTRRDSRARQEHKVQQRLQERKRKSAPERLMAHKELSLV